LFSSKSFSVPALQFPRLDYLSAMRRLERIVFILVMAALLLGAGGWIDFNLTRLTGCQRDYAKKHHN
jgi:hypothetical protein